MIRHGLEVFSGPFGAHFAWLPLIKLEVLHEQLDVRVGETFNCLKPLSEFDRSRTIPLFPPDTAAVREAQSLGCRAVQLLVGHVGRGTGILDLKSVSSAVESASGTPIIFEGGLATSEHVLTAAELHRSW